MTGLVMFLSAVVLTGCLTSWVWCFVNRFEVSEGATVSEWVQVHGPRLVGEVMGCSFCFNWWLSWCVVAVALVVTGWWWLLAVPLFSTTVGRVLSI